MPKITPTFVKEDHWASCKRLAYATQLPRPQTVRVFPQHRELLPRNSGANAFVRGGEDDGGAVGGRPGQGLRLHGLTFHGMADVQVQLGRVQSVLSDIVGILHHAGGCCGRPFGPAFCPLRACA
jgi:hypothetical protein